MTKEELNALLEKVHKWGGRVLIVLQELGEDAAELVEEGKAHIEALGDYLGNEPLPGESGEPEEDPTP